MIGFLFACLQPAEEVLDAVKVQSADYGVTWSALSSEIIESNQMALSRFEVVLYSIRLPTCSNLSLNSWGINQAFAGHSEINIPSNWMQPTVLNLLEDGALHHYVEFDEQSLCELGVTYARWDGGTNNVVDGSEDAFSILLEGICTESNIPFRLETKVPSERILDLVGMLTGEGNNLSVLLEIPLDTVLNPLDCSQVDNWTASQALELLSVIQTNSNWYLELNHD